MSIFVFWKMWNHEMQSHIRTLILSHDFKSRDEIACPNAYYICWEEGGDLQLTLPHHLCPQKLIRHPSPPWIEYDNEFFQPFEIPLQGPHPNRPVMFLVLHPFHRFIFFCYHLPSYSIFPHSKPIDLPISLWIWQFSNSLCLWCQVLSIKNSTDDFSTYKSRWLEM